MSSFVAHAITGIATLEVARATRPEIFRGRVWLIAFPVVAALPDGDAVLAALGGSAFDFLSLPGGYPIHRGVTHSIAFGIVAALLAAILARPRSPRAWFSAWPWLAVTAATHPLIDTLMGLGAGIPLFWPLSFERYLSPFRLLPVAYFSYSVGGLVALLWEPKVWALTLHELVIFLPFLFLARLWRARRESSASGSVATPRTARLASAIALSAILCPALTLATALRSVDGVALAPPAPWIGAWLMIVVAACFLMWDSHRSAPARARAIVPVALSLLITAVSVYLV